MIWAVSVGIVSVMFLIMFGEYNMGSQVQIIGITGLPSSGKGEFSRIAKQYGFLEIIMGNVIRNEISKRDLEMTRENSNEIMLKLREERGEDIVAQLTSEWIQEAIHEGKNKILIDGIRSRKEVDFFKEKYSQLQVIAIHADPETRYHRSKSRRREDDAYSRESFHQRDQIELSVGIGNVIALSDILISSPDTLEEAEIIFSEVLTEVTTENTPLVS